MSFGAEYLTELFALDRPGIKWRHDIDYDPNCALELARLEHACHVRSTFYIRARGPYNPFSPDVRNVLYGILACGHRLGVHVDLELPRDAPTPPWLLARRTTHDYRLLASEYRIDRTVSFHAPPRAIYGMPVPGFEHVFQGSWPDRTVSDSRGVWHGAPVELLTGSGPACMSVHGEWHFWPEEKADEWRLLEAAKP